MFPLNGWAPDVYSQAPGPVGAAFAGIVVKSGVYAIIRIIYTLFDIDGAFDFLVKPFTPKDLLEVTGRALKQHELIREREKYLYELNSERNLSRQLINAMQEGVIITVREEEQAEEGQGRVAVIRIADNGPGIPTRVRRRIFEPFFTTKEEGSGLGLSIVARIIEEHGGRVTIESEEGKGASFTVSLPITSPEEVPYEHNPDH